MILTIVSAEWQLYKDDVSKVLLPTDVGMIAILPDHMNIATTLVSGTITVYPIRRDVSALDSFADHFQEFVIAWWLATIEYDVITVVVE